MKYLKNLSIEYDPKEEQNHDYSTYCNDFFEHITDDPIFKAQKILEALSKNEFSLESLTLAHRYFADEYEKGY